MTLINLTLNDQADVHLLRQSIIEVKALD